ncbi:hypothetical protein P3T36_007064 [Kitasatospora sp. MAP12-15]|nr:hypothetical protein [Kitasatospora sp. MAP12-44]
MAKSVVKRRSGARDHRDSRSIKTILNRFKSSSDGCVTDL